MLQETITSTERPKTPEEELAYLREQIAKKEEEIKASGVHTEREKLISEHLEAYRNEVVEQAFKPPTELSEQEVRDIAVTFTPEEHDTTVDGLFDTLKEKGIRNTLSIVERMNQPHLTDDFHRMLIQYVKQGMQVEGLPQKGSLWNVTHMTLYEVALPNQSTREERVRSIKEIASAMEQFYAGMLSLTDSEAGSPLHIALEIAVANNSEEIIFYIAVPDIKRDLFHKQIHALFPDVQLKEQTNDYNIFIPDGSSLGSHATYRENPIFPLRPYESFESDPIHVILNAFSKIEKEGGGAAIQIIFNPSRNSILQKYKEALKQVQNGVPPKKALDIAYTAGGEVFRLAKEFWSTAQKKEDEKDKGSINQQVVQNIENKIASNIVHTNIRVIASAMSETRAQEILDDLESAFNQFEDTKSNALKFRQLSKGKLLHFFRSFSFREFSEEHDLPMNLKELTTIMHIPTSGLHVAPQFKHAKSGAAPAPVNLPGEGALLGINRYRSSETKVYFAKEDRLRHFYCIGQTGTGKTTLLKNLILQDIQDGEGVCMIDPHGSDIQDILGAIPEERFNDVIYFDPSSTEKVLALNMLEYDPAYPEQKTFVVNELFGIFQKLYGANPESMGPMFEQYFRNATMLVLEDPDTGNTLLDVSRVLSEESFRDMKLARCRNPIVTQFWRDIATKAGGEGALQNIVPYITSKFDVFMANDIMRPLIAQEKSSFNFRQIMDERKIFLVNLSKGRLGDINSHLIGLIIVGKLLMAALSRVDSLHKNLPTLYLYIDEFQNVTTDSIATILSEARKYKLSLHLAHQFIAQLDDKIRDSVFGNVGSLAAFRVGTDDAMFLEKQFEPVFTANDLMNIDNYNAYVRLLVRGVPTQPFSVSILPPQKRNIEKIEKLKELSYATYGKNRRDVEESIRAKYHI